MRRITPEEVLKAYEETGATPEIYGWYDHNRNCACAIGALILQDKGKEAAMDIFYPIYSSETDKYTTIFNRLTESLGLTNQYISGFIASFDDGASYDHGLNEEYTAGVEDGLKVREAVFNKYPNTTFYPEGDGE